MEFQNPLPGDMLSFSLHVKQNPGNYSLGWAVQRSRFRVDERQQAQSKRIKPP